MTVKRAFSGFVFEDMPAEEPVDIPVDMPGMIEPEKEGMPWWQITLIGLGCFVITLFVVRAITIKVMMKKIEEEI